MSVIRIPLTKGYEAIIDEADLPMVADRTWHASVKEGKFPYAEAPAKKNGRSITIAMHRLLMAEPIGLLVDHRNGNTLDNRRENLRITTHQGNSQNRIPTASSGFRNVYFHKKTGKWMAAVKFEARSYYLGLFDDPSEAAGVATAKRRELGFAERAA